MRVRTAQITDIAMLDDLGREFHMRYARSRAYDTETVSGTLRELIIGSDPNRIIFVSEDEEGVLDGFLLGSLERWLFSTQHKAKILLLFVAGDHRHHGDGRRLIRAFEQWAFLRRVDSIELPLSLVDPDFEVAQTGMESMGYQRAEVILRRMVV